MKEQFINLTIEAPVSGFAFSGPVSALLKGRHAWAALQEVMSQGLVTMHRVAGVDAQAWVAAVDGADSPQTPGSRVVLLFTSLSPLSTEASAALERVVAQESPQLVPQGPRSLDEVNPFPCLACAAGVVHQVWVEDGEQLVAFRLGLDDDDEPRVFGYDWPMAEPDGFISSVPNLVLHFHPVHEDEELGDEERHRVCLQVAFTWHMAQQLAGRGRRRSAVQQALDELFPPELLEASGFMDNEGGWLEEAFQVALTESLQILPRVLSHDEKSNIVQRLLELALLGGHLTAQQARVISQVAVDLGLSPDDLSVALPLVG